MVGILVSFGARPIFRDHVSFRECAYYTGCDSKTRQLYICWVTLRIPINQPLYNWTIGMSQQVSIAAKISIWRKEVLLFHLVPAFHRFPQQNHANLVGLNSLFVLKNSCTQRNPPIFCQELIIILNFPTMLFLKTIFWDIADRLPSRTSFNSVLTKFLRHIHTLQ